MKKNDSKYFYTASLMNSAILALLEKKDIEFITITEITKKAGVNRSTFYLHYDSVNDLLEETIENLNKEFLKSFEKVNITEINNKNDAFWITESYLIPYLNFCKQYKRVLKLVYQKPQLFNVQNAYKKMYDKLFYPAISMYLKNENERVYKLEYFTQGVVGIVHKWIELDCQTEIAEVINIIKQCISYEK